MSCPQYYMSGNSDQLNDDPNQKTYETLLNNAQYERQMYVPAYTRNQPFSTEHIHQESILLGNHQRASGHGACDVINIPQGTFNGTSVYQPTQLEMQQTVFRRTQDPLLEMDFSKYAMKIGDRALGFTSFDALDTRSLMPPQEPKTTRSYGTYPVQAALQSNAYQLQSQLQKYQ